MTLPSHLSFLEELIGYEHDGLEEYYPETAAGEIEARRGEELFYADGMVYRGPTDGTMVPIDAENLEPMPENIFDEGKFSALVEAAESGDQPVVDPGYADIFEEYGELTAQVRDGNHRTFAGIAAGADFAWVLMSDRTRQDLDLREGTGTEALYRRIRKAQKAQGAPQYKRRRIVIVEASSELSVAEKRLDAIDRLIQKRYVMLFNKYGYAESGFSPEEQEERAQLFWRQRVQQIDDSWFDSPVGRKLEKLQDERSRLLDWLYDARRQAGVPHGQRAI